MKNNKGQALVEFIIVLPILLFVIMIIIDLSNIFIKKNSLENDLDIITDMYKVDDFINVNNYVKNNNLNIEYEKENEFIIINLSKTIKIHAPILNNILGRNYKLTTSRVMYE